MIRDSPGQGIKHVQPAPDPDGLIENLQHRLVDALRPEQPAVGPPGRRPRFVEVVDRLYREPFRLQQLPRIPRAVAALVPQAAVEGPEQARAVRHQHHQRAGRFQAWRGEDSPCSPDRPGIRAHSGRAPCRSSSASPARSSGTSGSMRCTTTLGVRRKRLRSACRCSGSFSAAT